MIEKVKDTTKVSGHLNIMAESLVTVFHGELNPHQSDWIGSKKHGFRTKPEQNNLKIVDLSAFFKKSA